MWQCVPFQLAGRLVLVRYLLPLTRQQRRSRRHITTEEVLISRPSMVSLSLLAAPVPSSSRQDEKVKIARIENSHVPDPPLRARWLHRSANSRGTKCGLSGIISQGLARAVSTRRWGADARLLTGSVRVSFFPTWDLNAREEKEINKVLTKVTEINT